MLSALPTSAALDLWAWLSSRHILEVAALAGEVGRRHGMHGTARLPHLLTLVDRGAVSGGEFRLHTLLREAGMSGWEPGVTVRDAAGIIGVVDVLFIRGRLVIEFDGWRAHSSPASFVHDRRRQNRLVAAGYIVLRFTWDDLRDRPAQVIADIRRSLEMAVA